MNYEIQIGKVIDLASGTLKPRRVIHITKEQFSIIEMFANQTKDIDLNTIYRLNDCEFKVIPSLEASNSQEKLSDDLTEFSNWLVYSYQLKLNTKDMVTEYLSQEAFNTILK
jgi:hypothetical protein